MIIDLKNISVSFDGEPILKNLNLYIRDKEFITLLGPSGCGKTTTLKMISGFLKTDKGQILVDDQDITTLAPEKRPVSTVFQSYALFPHMSVLENVIYGLKFRGIRKKEAREMGMEYLKIVDMEEYAGASIGEISGGQQQRTAIGRAIVKNPDILLCDEPTGALDYNTSKEILKLIEDVNKKYGNTIIMVTHNEAIKNMADHVIKLRDGAVRHNDININKVSAEELEW